jgi:branched-chain amino acid transport system substrate-binding protein
MPSAEPGRPSRALRPRLPLRTAAAFAAVIAASAAACAGLRGPDREPIRFGVPLPLTSMDGKPDVYGENGKMGAELALREINAQGGIGGRRLEFRELDDRGDDSTAIGVAQQLFDDPKVVAVVGHVYSSTTIQAASIYQRGLPAVATSATSAEISGLGPWIFRVASSDSSNAAALARTAREMGLAAEIVYSNDDYGRGLDRFFGQALRAGGGRVLGSDPILDDMADFGPYLARLGRRGAGLVFLADAGGGAAKVIAQARALRMPLRFMGGDGIEALADGTTAYDGTMVGSLFHPDATEASRKFAASYRAAFHREPDSSSALGYDAVMLLAEAVRAGNTTRQSIRDWLETVGRPGGAPAFEGVAGRVAFDEDGDPTGKAVYVSEIRNGRLQLSKVGR